MLIITLTCADYMLIITLTCADYMLIITLKCADYMLIIIYDYHREARSQCPCHSLAWFHFK